eukprot:403348989
MESQLQRMPKPHIKSEALSPFSLDLNEQRDIGIALLESIDSDLSSYCQQLPDLDIMSVEDLINLHKTYAFDIKSLKQKVRLSTRGFLKKNNIKIIKNWRLQKQIAKQIISQDFSQQKNINVDQTIEVIESQQSKPYLINHPEVDLKIKIKPSDEFELTFCFKDYFKLIHEKQSSTTKSIAVGNENSIERIKKKSIRKQYKKSNVIVSNKYDNQSRSTLHQNNSIGQNIISKKRQENDLFKNYLKLPDTTLSTRYSNECQPIMTKYFPLGQATSNFTQPGNLEARFLGQSGAKLIEDGQLFYESGVSSSLTNPKSFYSKMFLGNKIGQNINQFYSQFKKSEDSQQQVPQIQQNYYKSPQMNQQQNTSFMIRNNQSHLENNQYSNNIFSNQSFTIYLPMDFKNDQQRQMDQTLILPRQ